MAVPACHHTIKTLAERWAVSQESVRQRILRGDFVALKIGKLYRIPVAIVEAYEQGVQTCATESETSPGEDTSTSPGPKAVELEPYRREAMILRQLSRISPES